ncbi:MAG: CHASE2 domain-containing protein, partial [Moraxellaceae bacterium]
MQKGLSFWKKDWVAGLVITLGVLIAASATDVVDRIENYAYDLGVRTSSKEPGDRIAVIAIDDQSIANMGRWPWPRTTLAKMVSDLNKGGARAIGLPFFLSEPQIDPGLASIRELNAFYEEQLAALSEETPALLTLGEKLGEVEARLDTDQHLADAMANAGNVV